ncbi:MAG: hypothetical protein NVS2B12_26330 [Ktedonobacteraceae bacterium]
MLHLVALTIALCVALALMAFTTPAVHAATTQNASIQAANTMARGGGGSSGGGGGHGGASEGGAHGNTSEGGILHSGDENTGGSGNNYRGHNLPFLHTGTSSSQGGDDSVLSLLITLAVLVGVIALIIYLIWYRVRLQHRS